jgi:hypothetical protein
MSSVALALALVLAAPPALASDAAPPPSAAKPPAGQLVLAEGEAAVRALFDREVPPLAKRPFKTPAGVGGTVEAAAPPQVTAAAGAEEIAVGLGTGQPLSCTVFGERIDAAATIYRVVESAREKVKVVLVRPLDVVAVEGSPLVLAALLYQVQLEKGPVVGQLKIGVYAHPSRSLLCVHDEPGYVATFGRVVRGLAASLSGGPRDERTGAAFAELSVIRVGGLAVGYGENVVWKAEGGGRVSEHWGAQLLPRADADLVTMDSTSRETIDGDGLLAGGTYAHSTGGELDTRIELSRDPDGKTYRYEGEKDGKPLQGAFVTKAGLSTELWFARRLAKGAPAAAEVLRHEAYSCESSPVAPTSVVYRRDPAAPRRATMELGAMRVTGDLDDAGILKGGEMPVGPTKLVMERVYVRGAP